MELIWIFKIIAIIIVCISGGYSMKITNGKTGIGWSILGILIILWYFGDGLTGTLIDIN